VKEQTKVVIAHIYLYQNNRDVGKWPENAKEKSMFLPDSAELFYINVRLFIGFSYSVLYVI
jgi:hypothetical protein